jgi:glycosyltransferase involved in cell wall biosynthesis
MVSESVGQSAKNGALIPHVSVLLPCRDAAPYLTDCIDSIAEQTFTDLEIIAVDDGSTDRTPELLNEWSRRDSRVRVRSPGRVGLVRALQLALADARGDLLARMDADDVCAPTRFEKQVDLLGRVPDLAACGTQVRYFPAEHVREGALAYQDWLNTLCEPDDLDHDIFVECPIAHPALMARRNTIEAVGGYLDHVWPEDYDLILRLWAAGHRLANVPEVLLHWRERADRLSRTDERYSPQAFRRCKVHYLGETLLRNRPAIVWGAGPVGKALARELLDRGHAMRGFIDIDPRKIGQHPCGLPVFSMAALDHLTEEFILAAVGSSDARQLIRSFLHAKGLREMEDFCAVA